MKGFKKEDFKKELQEGVDRVNELLGTDEQFEEEDLDRLAGFLERLEKSRDPRMMLPSQEMAYLKAFILEKFFEAGFSSFTYLEPKYRLEQAIRDLKEDSRVERISEAFDQALAEYNRKCPMGWDTSKNSAFRRIDGKKVYPV